MSGKGQGICCVCDEAITGNMVGAGDGSRTGADGHFAHPECFELREAQVEFMCPELVVAVAKFGRKILANAVFQASVDRQIAAREARETAEAKPVPGSLVDAPMEDPAVGTVKVARDLLSRIDDDPWDWKRGHVYRPNAGDESDRKYYGGALVCESVKAHNAAFIAKAPALVAVLCREVERLVRERDLARAGVAGMAAIADRYKDAEGNNIAQAEADLATANKEAREAVDAAAKYAADLTVARERNAELENELADVRKELSDANAARDTFRSAINSAYESLREWDNYASGDLSVCVREVRRILTADHPQAFAKLEKERAEATREAADARMAFSSVTRRVLGARHDEALVDAAARVVRERDEARWMAAEAWRWVEMARKDWTDAKEALEDLTGDFADVAQAVAAVRDESRNLKAERDDARKELKGYRDALSDADAELSDVGWRDSVVHGIRMLKKDRDDWRNKALEANREAWTAKQRLKSIVACAAADGEKGGAE